MSGLFASSIVCVASRHMKCTHILCVRELMLLNYVLQKTLESPLDSKEINPVNPKGN